MDEFDLENRVWSIPAERMKMRRPGPRPAASTSRYDPKSSASGHGTRRRVVLIGETALALLWPNAKWPNGFKLS